MFVLIIILIAIPNPADVNFRRVSSVSMQEFTSEASCNNARKLIAESHFEKSARPTLIASCEKK